jgi:hypothetical protein
MFYIFLTRVKSRFARVNLKHITFGVEFIAISRHLLMWQHARAHTHTHTNIRTQTSHAASTKGSVAAIHTTHTSTQTRQIHMRKCEYARNYARSHAHTHVCLGWRYRVFSIPLNKYSDSLILFSHVHLSLSPTTLYITRAEKSKFESTTSAPPRLFPSSSKSINTSPPGCTCIRVVSFCFCVLCTCVCTRVCARVCPWYQWFCKHGRRTHIHTNTHTHTKDMQMNRMRAHTWLRTKDTTIFDFFLWRRSKRHLHEQYTQSAVARRATMKNKNQWNHIVHGVVIRPCPAYFCISPANNSRTSPLVVCTNYNQPTLSCSYIMKRRGTQLLSELFFDISKECIHLKYDLCLRS